MNAPFYSLVSFFALFPLSSISLAQTPQLPNKPPHALVTISDSTAKRVVVVKPTPAIEAGPRGRKPAQQRITLERDCFLVESPSASSPQEPRLGMEIVTREMVSNEGLISYAQSSESNTKTFAIYQEQLTVSIQSIQNLASEMRCPLYQHYNSCKAQDGGVEILSNITGKRIAFIPTSGDSDAVIKKLSQASFCRTTPLSGAEVSLARCTLGSYVSSAAPDTKSTLTLNITKITLAVKNGMIEPPRAFESSTSRVLLTDLSDFLDYYLETIQTLSQENACAKLDPKQVRCTLTPTASAIEFKNAESEQLLYSYPLQGKSAAQITEIRSKLKQNGLCSE